MAPRQANDSVECKMENFEGKSSRRVLTLSYHKKVDSNDQ